MLQLLEAPRRVVHGAEALLDDVQRLELRGLVAALQHAVRGEARPPRHRQRAVKVLGLQQGVHDPLRRLAVEADYVQRLGDDPRAVPVVRRGRHRAAPRGQRRVEAVHEWAADAPQDGGPALEEHQQRGVRVPADVQHGRRRVRALLARERAHGVVEREHGQPAAPVDDGGVRETGAEAHAARRGAHVVAAAVEERQRIPEADVDGVQAHDARRLQRRAELPDGEEPAAIVAQRRDDGRAVLVRVQGAALRPQPAALRGALLHEARAEHVPVLRPQAEVGGGAGRALRSLQRAAHGVQLEAPVGPHDHGLRLCASRPQREPTLADGPRRGPSPGPHLGLQVHAAVLSHGVDAQEACGRRRAQEGGRAADGHLQPPARWYDAEAHEAAPRLPPLAPQQPHQPLVDLLPLPQPLLGRPVEGRRDDRAVVGDARGCAPKVR